LSLTLKWAEQRQQPLLTALALLTSKPANVIGGVQASLSKNAPADLCIFNPDQEWMVSADTLMSQGKHTPFLGYELKGLVTTTVIAGQVVFERAANSSEKAKV
jgi:dihydroorotase